MSIVAPSQRRLAWPMAISLAIAMLVALLLYLPTRPDGITLPSVAAPGVAQASWDVNTFPAGGAGHRRMGPQAKTRLKAQREPLAALVRDVYDALFLQPAGIKQVIRQRFAPDAASSALTKKIGLPTGATDVAIKERLARIGIYVGSADRAAARVKIAGVASKDERKAKFKHESTLWLERKGRTWKVIAFDITQGPGK